METNSIALINDYGFTPQNHSKKQMQWLKYLAHKHNLNIIHCLNGNEFKIDKYSVDGYFNGCPLCIKTQRQTFNPHKLTTMKDLYALTYIRSQGFDFVEIWELEWDKLVIEDEVVAEFVKNCDI
jgi:tRNA(Glu) U13 pseudouridine synthase TruD